MHVVNYGNWPMRSLAYLGRRFDELKEKDEEIADLNAELQKYIDKYGKLD